MKKIIIKLLSCILLFIAGILFKTLFLDMTLSIEQTVITGGIMSLGLISSVVLIFDYEE